VTAFADPAAAQVGLWNLIFQAEVIEQRFRAVVLSNVVLSNHDQRATPEAARFR
jgi:hypothetical protein